MNARLATLCDFTTADSIIADLFEFDKETLLYYNQAEQNTLNINRNRHTQIATDTSLSKFALTFHNQSLIDYKIC